MLVHNLYRDKKKKEGTVYIYISKKKKRKKERSLVTSEIHTETF